MSSEEQIIKELRFMYFNRSNYTINEVDALTKLITKPELKKRLNEIIAESEEDLNLHEPSQRPRFQTSEEEIDAWIELQESQET